MKKSTLNFIVLFFIITSSFAQNTLDVEFKTGEDDLRGIGTPEFSPDLNLIFVNKPTIFTRNINRDATWPKNSIRKISIPLDASMVIGDLLAMELTRQHTNSKNPTSKSPDNWDIARIIVTGTFRTNGQIVKYELLNTEITRQTPWRMTYDNSEIPKRFDFIRNPTVISGNGWIEHFAPPRTARINATIGVGGDDLRGGNNDNAKVVITFKNSPLKLTYGNINNKEGWGNFSEHTVSKEIPSLTGLGVNDINTVELWHTGGGGMGADNWDIDKFILSITINGQTKQLVDKAGAPLHRFTGDTRRKTFYVE